MRDYAKAAPQFWTGARGDRRGRAITAESADVSARLRGQVIGSIDQLIDEVMEATPVRDLESPLEVLFHATWVMSMRLHDPFPTVFSLDPQFEVQCGKRYRLDFRVVCREVGADPRDEIRFDKLAIELDGHEFHERTKEQVAYRNTRDRDLQSDGWVVLHFSGSEVWRDPVKCVESVIDVGDAQLRRLCVERSEARQRAVDEASAVTQAAGA